MLMMLIIKEHFLNIGVFLFKKIDRADAAAKIHPNIWQIKKLEEVRQNAYDDYIANKQASQREEYERWLRDTFDNTN